MLFYVKEKHGTSFIYLVDEIENCRLEQFSIS